MVTYRHPKGHTNENPAPLGYAGEYVVEVCHSFVTEGRIQFLGDCTHALANQTVDLPDWTEEDAPVAEVQPHRSEPMSNAVLTIGYADVPGFPPGSVVAHIVVLITNQSASPPASQSQVVAPGTVTVNFDNLAEGDYSVSVQANAADGTPLGSPAIGTFKVAVPASVTLSLPTSVGAQVS